MVENSTFESAMRYMIKTGHISQESYIRFQAQFLSEFNFFKSMYSCDIECGDKLKLYDILRTESNVLYRVFFCYHHQLDPDKIKNTTIRSIIDAM